MLRLQEWSLTPGSLVSKEESRLREQIQANGYQSIISSWGFEPILNKSCMPLPYCLHPFFPQRGKTDFY